MLAQHELRMLSEISHKLDYAIRSAAQSGAAAPVAPPPDAGGARLDPAIVQTLHALMLPQQPEVLHQRLLELALQMCEGERGFLMLIEEGRKLRFKLGLGMDQNTIQHEAGYSRGVIKQVVQTGEPVLIPDTSQAHELGAGGARPRSVMCVSLIFGARQGGQGQVGGILYIDSPTTAKVFDAESLQLFQHVADMGSTAMENAADLLSGGGVAAGPGPDAGKLQQNFARLLDVGRTISSTLVLEDLLELVIEKVLEVTRADRGFLMLVEEGNEEPVFKIGLTWNKKDGAARRKRKLDQSQFFFSRTVTRQAVNEKRSVVLKDVAGGGNDPSVSMVQMELHAVMCTPLVEKGNVLGLIYVDSKAANQTFDDSDLELFEALAGQAAIGLKNAMLYTKVATQQRVESEIAIAANMQKDLCPDTVPQIQGLQLSGYMEPAREVGGDYYDYVEDTEFPGQVLGIVVGDVSGKGLGAGIVAVMARCFLRSMISAYGLDDPSQLLRYLNHTLCGELKPGKFMTMLLMEWDGRRSVLRYASSGHENIIVWRAATRRAEALTSGGSPLGISRTTGGPTPNAELQLGPGDTCVTYTDGVTEAMNENDDEYTLERLLALVNHHGGKDPATLERLILEDVAKHRQTREQTDDITMVILRRV